MPRPWPFSPSQKKNMLKAKWRVCGLPFRLPLTCSDTLRTSENSWFKKRCAMCVLLARRRKRERRPVSAQPPVLDHPDNIIVGTGLRIFLRRVTAKISWTLSFMLKVCLREMRDGSQRNDHRNGTPKWVQKKKTQGDPKMRGGRVTESIQKGVHSRKKTSSR